MNKDYFNILDIYNKYSFCNLFLIISPKGIGKTSSCIRYSIDNKSKGKTLFLTRYSLDLITFKKEILGEVKKFYKYKGLFWKDTCLYYNDEVLLYANSLTNFTRIKNIEEINYGVFDEFIAKDGRYKGKDLKEFDYFTELVSNLERTKKDFKFTLLANANDFNNPYFLALGVKNEKGFQIITLKNNKKVLVYIIGENEYLNGITQKTLAYGLASKKDKLFRYMFGGDFAFNNLTLINNQIVKKDYEIWYNLLIDSYKISFVKYQEKFYFIEYIKNNKITVNLTFNDTLLEQNNNTIEPKELIEMWEPAFYNKLIYFENYVIQNKIINYIINNKGIYGTR